MALGFAEECSKPLGKLYLVPKTWGARSCTDFDEKTLGNLHV